jgi:hypothetical protein
MKAIFSVVGLLVVVLVVGLLAKKQLSAGVAPPPQPGTPAGITAPAGTPQQQVKQFEQAVNGAMQQARPMPENDK